MTRRILIIDDEENIREMIQLALEAVGYEVGEADSGMEAFAVIGGNDSWDAVFLDQKMPGLTGTEILRRLKVLIPTVPVIMMTAYASIDLAVEAMKLGATDFVRKPMTPDILRNALSAALTKPLAQKSPIVSLSDQDVQTSQITLNGFTILPDIELTQSRNHSRNERRFVVRSPDGQDHHVIVEIDPLAIAAVAKMTPVLPASTSFWTEQAKQFLSDFLWNDGHVPATESLKLKGVDRDEVERAVKAIQK